jgi:OOP family OmpA-OmpF porin
MRRLLPLGLAAAIAAMVSFPEPAHPTRCVSGPFMVFFDPNADEIVGDGRAILDNVASVYGTCGQTGIIIAGHADRSGSHPNNMSLARRRADRVHAYLVERGLPDEAMLIRAFGERRPLVDTADDVAEARNRRVEITFYNW